MDSFKEQSGAVLLPTLLPLSYGHTRLKGRHLRQLGVVGKFVEFFGPGVEALSIADRATISNMCPEYGATVGFFPIDDKSMIYLRQTKNEFIQLAAETRAKVGGWGWRKLNVCGIGGVRGKSRKGTAFSELVGIFRASRLGCTQDLSQADEVLVHGNPAFEPQKVSHQDSSEIVAPMRLDLYRDRDEKKVLVVEEYLRAVKMFRDFKDSSQDPVFSEIVTLDLATVQSSVSGPKRPHDRVSVTDMPVDFKQCLTNKSRGTRGRRGKGWDSQRKEREGMGFSEQLCTTLDGALFECSPVSRSLEIEVSCLE
uniref:Aconitase/3-isopropylmalate dehydratase large subunit alpha/beta/alpha domain-containing protein n=1 Tax=Timema tahoe TaxID=61484 RepID=A0A7R9IPT8_9NEOP|nr:unnamed protein product [Timema tahoe]